ncbi:unnamed protein product, partial [Mesorhabditis belari]|uniref:MARVEL domain-containing protein n=1 Tax=Mesorhabditis belari TaxID=2138241 RepID=A0AAF3EVG3_9BILA
MDLNSHFDSDIVFLKLPHLFKPLQVICAIVLAICVGSTGGGENGVIWFVVFVSLIISALATALFALKIQDSVIESISNGSLTWSVVEMVYSFVLAVLSAISIWLSFGLASKVIFGSSAGYIAAGLFFIVHAVLYAAPCVMLYDAMQANGRAERNDVQVAHPFSESSYQYDV